MDNRDLLILNTLYEEKNITKAAKKLFITQPALTKRLQLMEKEFKVQIVKRERRGVRFTEQGEYLAKNSKDFLNKYEKIKEDVLNMNEDVRGVLKLGVSSFFTKYKLPKILRAFKDKYPNVEFKIITKWSSDIFNLIYKRDIHVGILQGEFKWSGEKYLVYEDNLCIASKEKIDIKKLPELQRITYKTDILLKNTIDNWWSENFRETPSVSIEVDHADTCREMILNGLGYGIMPRKTVRSTDDIYEVTLLNKKGEPIIRKTWMMYNEEDMDIKVVKAFVEFVKAYNI